MKLILRMGKKQFQDLLKITPTINARNVPDGVKVGFDKLVIKDAEVVLDFELPENTSFLDMESNNAK